MVICLCMALSQQSPVIEQTQKIHILVNANHDRGLDVQAGLLTVSQLINKNGEGEREETLQWCCRFLCALYLKI